MPNQAMALSKAQVDEFNQNGLLVIRGFYDLDRDVIPIQRDIYELIGLVVGKCGLAIERPPFDSATFDAGFQQLIAHDRRLGSEIYDAVKQIPAFVRLVSSEKNQDLFRQVRGRSLPAIAGGGYGIRIDNPNEESFRAPWHQEYPAQLRSPDGVVMWSPLVEMTEALGPVEFCVGSHLLGIIPVSTRDPDNPNKSGAYALRLKNEAQLISSYPRVAPLTKPGDLVLVDFLTLHTSGFNVSDRSRWSMQFRYFNFRNPTGIRIGWKGSFAAGVDFRTVHPDLAAG
jgi:ectoine hydroxylase-related dioxygenase (phytanoyl-CoA dioxygenase family)